VGGGLRLVLITDSSIEDAGFEGTFSRIPCDWTFNANITINKNNIYIYMYVINFNQKTIFRGFKKTILIIKTILQKTILIKSQKTIFRTFFSIFFNLFLIIYYILHVSKLFVWNSPLSSKLIVKFHFAKCCALSGPVYYTSVEREHLQTAKDAHQLSNWRLLRLSRGSV
jgi:hypothetical protein